MAKAFESFRRLRQTDLQAARDVYYCYVNVEIERKVSRGRNMIVEMFAVPRNRRAAWASWIVMFMQQFCGVNVIGKPISSLHQSQRCSARSIPWND